MGIWARVESWANRFGIWVTALTALTGFFTWVATYLVLLKPYGWAEAMFVGLLTTMALTVVLSAGLISWRFFRPLPIKAALSNQPTLGYVPPISTPELGRDLREQIAQLEERLTARFDAFVTHQSHQNGLFVGELTDIKASIAIDMPNASTVAEAYKNLDDATAAKIARISTQTSEFHARLQRDDLDLLQLFYFGALQASESILVHLLSLVPDLSGDEDSDLNIEAHEKNLAFIEVVGDGLSGSQRSSSYRNVLMNAESQTDIRLEKLPKDQWQTHSVNPIELRRFFNSALSRRYLVSYLESELKKVREDIRNGRAQMVERKENREKLRRP